MTENGIITFTFNLGPETEAALTELIKAVTTVMDPETLAAILGTRGFTVSSEKTQNPPQGADEPTSPVPTPASETLSYHDKAKLVIEAYGGANNILAYDACITRLRVTVDNGDKVDKTVLKSLGAAGVLQVGNEFQGIFGVRSKPIMIEMQNILGC